MRFFLNLEFEDLQEVCYAMLDMKPSHPQIMLAEEVKINLHNFFDNLLELTGIMGDINNHIFMHFLSKKIIEFREMYETSFT